MHQAVRNMLPDTGTEWMIFCPGISVRWSILTTTHHF
jgi:hypothetical protein